MENILKKAAWLNEAMPYMQKYHNKTVVVKYGGSAMLNEELKSSVMRDITLLSAIGINVVLVHGGGPEINSMLARLGKEAVFIDGLRYTDAETAEVVAMVLAGKVNKGLVALIHSNKGRAIGLCGVDAGMITAERIERETDLGFVGIVSEVDPACISMAIDRGYIPVVATIGADKSGQVYNINADTAAAAIAGAMQAEKFITMTDVAGVLADQSDESSLISEIKTEDVPELIARGVIAGGMIPKVESCVTAINEGLKEAAIIDGRIEHSILIELFSDRGNGTLLRKYHQLK
ncbi:MAG: acetylglutamate kinase [Clostridiales Family XIII bacterium]|jgi:acetylglutamate kinase|nr:acetylglutamate kinase [Clostridiales Family XIII bacterium]